jgi:hypothetical protein
MPHKSHRPLRGVRRHEVFVAVVTNDDPSVALCTLAGDATAEHDYRPYTYERFGRPHTSWRCVWCHAVACGDYGEDDPCWLPYHHGAAPTGIRHHWFAF